MISVAAQREEGINRRRASCGHAAGEQRHRRERRGDDPEGDWIAGSDAEQERFEYRAERNRRDQVPVQ